VWFVQRRGPVRGQRPAHLSFFPPLLWETPRGVCTIPVSRDGRIRAVRWWCWTHPPPADAIALDIFLSLSRWVERSPSQNGKNLATLWLPSPQIAAKKGFSVRPYINNNPVLLRIYVSSLRRLLFLFLFVAAGFSFPPIETCRQRFVLPSTSVPESGRVEGVWWWRPSTPLPSPSIFSPMFFFRRFPFRCRWVPRSFLFFEIAGARSRMAKPSLSSTFPRHLTAGVDSAETKGASGIALLRPVMSVISSGRVLLPFGPEIMS